MAASGIRAYASQIGQITSSGGTNKIKFKHFVIADCGRGATLRFGRGGRTNNHDFEASFEDSYISAISRPNCV